MKGVTALTFNRVENVEFNLWSYVDEKVVHTKLRQVQCSSLLRLYSPNWTLHTAIIHACNYSIGMANSCYMSLEIITQDYNHMIDAMCNLGLEIAWETWNSVGSCYCHPPNHTYYSTCTS